MKIKIKNKTYNTETAKILEHITHGNFGDTDGYEENLFQTKKGEFFLHGLGGPDSKYPTETIIPVTEKDAKDWKKANK